jgi:hypothetical protein
MAAALMGNANGESQDVRQKLGQPGRAGQADQHLIPSRIVDPGGTGSVAAAVPMDDAGTYTAPRMQRLPTTGAELPSQEEDDAKGPADTGGQNEADLRHWALDALVTTSQAPR